eukprot:scaffold65969_cov23-Tisochrysis_lutea.AAC.1
MVVDEHWLWARAMGALEGAGQMMGAQCCAWLYTQRPALSHLLQDCPTSFCRVSQPALDAPVLHLIAPLITPLLHLTTLLVAP